MLSSLLSGGGDTFKAIRLHSFLLSCRLIGRANASMAVVATNDFYVTAGFHAASKFCNDDAGKVL
jgi:hypothetical protein